jgi:NADPH-dependent 2,4-dienoyl-CoA reductase/sulfur reductase-like enzyme
MAKTGLRDRDWYGYIALISTASRRASRNADLKLCAEEKDLVIIGGGVAGYVAAIKAGQEGLKVRSKDSTQSATTIQNTV